MKDNGTIVVYQSEGQRTLDQWYWNGGGAGVVAWVAGVFVLIVFACFTYTQIKHKRRWW